MLARERRESDHGDLLIRLRRVYLGWTTCRMYLQEVLCLRKNTALGLERYAVATRSASAQLGQYEIQCDCYRSTSKLSRSSTRRSWSRLTHPHL